jgi:hypothetical protein
MQLLCDLQTEQSRQGFPPSSISLLLWLAQFVVAHLGDEWKLVLVAR